MSETEDPRPAAEGIEIDPDDEPGRSHLDDLPDGSGCAEIWDHLSDRRRD